MNDNIPLVELPERATFKEQLAGLAASIRVGEEVEHSGLEPIN